MIASFEIVTNITLYNVINITFSTFPTKKRSKNGKKSKRSNKKHTVDSSPELKQMSKKPKTQLELSTTASEQETSSQSLRKSKRNKKN